MRNWAGNVMFGAARVHRPGSVDELRRVVAGSERVRALGSRHSFSGVADTTDDLVLLDGIPPAVEVDAGAGTATVTAGMTYAQVVVELQRAGFALANMASLPHISVAGSVATGTHGSGATQRSLAAAVVGIESIGPDGDLTTTHRDSDPDRFPGSVVALGALGVVTRLTLSIEPAYTMTQAVRVSVPLDEVATGLDDLFAAAYSVSLFTDWRGDAHVYLKSRTDRPATGWDLGRPAEAPVHPVPGMPTDWCTEQLGAVGWWHERLPHFRAEFVPGAGKELQSEYFVARESAPAAFAALREIGEVVAPVIHIAEVRAVRGDDLWLSPAYGRDTVTFHFTWLDAEAEVAPVMKLVEQALFPLGARPHWGKLTAAAPADLVARYERGPDFASLMRAVDPDRKFTNSFVDGLFPTQ